MSAIRLSILVSAYNSDQYMEKCLQDLLEQSIVRRGEAEIIVVDCDSPGHEGEIVRAAQQSNKNIAYIRWPERVTLYEAWNIGGRLARGQYLTNANTDDRHAPECLARLCQELDDNPQLDLVYGDVFESTVPNETFAQNSKSVRYIYKPYFAPEVVLHYQFGCQPVWRASVHRKIGWFDGTFRAAGDYEFNFRFALAGLKAGHVPEPLGLFLNRNDSLSTQDTTSGKEAGMLRAKYISAESILALYGRSGWNIGLTEGRVAALHDMIVRACQVAQPWHPGRTFADPDVALCCCFKALELAGSSVTITNNLAVVLRLAGKVEEATQVLQSIRSSDLHPIVQRNCAVAQRGAVGSESLEVCPELDRVAYT